MAIAAIVTATAMTPAAPAFAVSGTTVATTIAPGSVSSMRRTRTVIGTCPISQKPMTRVKYVARAIARIPAIGPMYAGLFIDEAPDDASRNRTDDDEPVTSDQLRCRQSDHAGNRPADRAPRAAPHLYRHGRKEDRQQHVEAEPRRVGDERAE